VTFKQVQVASIYRIIVFHIKGATEYGGMFTYNIDCILYAIRVNWPVTTPSGTAERYRNALYHCSGIPTEYPGSLQLLTPYRKGITKRYDEYPLEQTP
jgi:hypothetical protein